MGLAVLGLGALSIACRDFAMNWQPYPAGLAGREIWGLASGVTAAVGGALLILPRTRGLGGLLLAIFLGPWVVGLHVPLVAPNPLDVAKLNGLVFSAAHFVYAEFTASMVPERLPMRLELAYLTGAIHALTGLAMLVGYRQRLAAGVEAAMMTSFVLLVHLPRIVADPGNRLELTMGCIALALSSAAWGLAFSKSSGR